jgi:LuxR family transcriptional regulator, quorum-sensing system regulator CviR
MGEALKFDNSISGDRLRSAFPFIRQNGGKTLARSRSAQSAAESHPEAPPSLKMPSQPFPAELFDDLTRKEMQCVLEILHYTMQATTGADVHQLLQLVQRVAASPLVIGGVAQLNSNGAFEEFNSVINVSYSNDWLYHYGTKGYATVDPVLQSVLSTFQTQVWEQTYKSANSKKQLEFMEEARSYGLTQGLTTGMPEPGRNFASFFSFAGGDPGHAIRYKNLLEYLLPYLHRILIANVHTPSANRVKGLSPRELMVLEWMKQGKTNWEISRIIGVSERTVRFHVESIFMKLDVGSRTQAVACAIEQGLFPST